MAKILNNCEYAYYKRHIQTRIDQRTKLSVRIEYDLLDAEQKMLPFNQQQIGIRVHILENLTGLETVAELEALVQAAWHGWEREDKLLLSGFDIGA